MQHLQVLVRFAGVDLWTADRIRPGENVREKLDEALGHADVALLLISSDFLASDFLQDVEVAKLFARREQGGVTVIPVIIRSCLWQAHPWLGKLKPLPTGEQPVAAFEGDGRDRALTEVATDIAQRAGALPVRIVAERAPQRDEFASGREESQKVGMTRAGGAEGLRPENMPIRSYMRERAIIIEKLVVRDFGPIKSLDAHLTAGLNIILGDNASGKTYLAEALCAILQNPRESQLRRALSREFRVPGRLDTGFHLAEGPGWTVEITIKDETAQQVVRVVGAPVRTQGELPKIHREVTPANSTSELLSKRLVDSHSGILFRADANLDFTNPRLREALYLLRDLSPSGRWRGILDLPSEAFKQGKSTQFSNSEITLINLAQAVVSQHYQETNVPFIVDDPERSFDERTKGLLSDLISRAAQHTQVLLICHELPVASMQEHVVGNLGEYGEAQSADTTDRAREAVSILLLEKPATVTRFDTKLDHSVAAAVSAGDSSQAHGTMNMQGVTVHAETVIFAGAAAPGAAPFDVVANEAPTRSTSAASSRPRPNYPDAETQRLSEKLEDTKLRRQRVRAHGRETPDLDREILELKRQLREGGRLRAGDSLGANDRYELLDVLGRGGFALVWLAYDNERGGNVAIKVLHSNLVGDKIRLERFKRGARIMSELHHEAIVRVLEPYGEDGGWHYFVMEYLRGGDFRRATLELRIKQGDVLPLMLRVCGAAALAHSQRIIHRDIKPANIVLDERGQPKLTDFDLVAAPDTTGGTRTGAVGTVVYTAPEILDGSMEASAASDVYSLAMTTLFGLYGNDLPMDVLRNPETAFELLYVAEPIKAEILRALDWDPWQRHPDAGKLGEALTLAMSVAGGAAMVARRDENQYSADEAIHPPLIPGLHRIVDPPPGLSIDVEYKRYYNSRFGFSVDVPTFFVPQPGPVNGDGRRFAYRKVVELVASGIYNWDDNNTVQGFFQEAMASAIEKKGTWMPAGAVEGNSYTMKTRLGNTIAYRKSTLANGVISGVSFSYPAAQDAYFDPIARRVLTSFRAPTRPDPRRE